MAYYSVKAIFGVKVEIPEAPLCKGSCRRMATEGLSLYNYSGAQSALDLRS